MFLSVTMLGCCKHGWEALEGRVTRCVCKKIAQNVAQAIFGQN
jgi:hypothetical protein